MPTMSAQLVVKTSQYSGYFISKVKKKMENKEIFVTLWREDNHWHVYKFYDQFKGAELYEEISRFRKEHPGRIKGLKFLQEIK